MSDKMDNFFAVIRGNGKTNARAGAGGGVGGVNAPPIPPPAANPAAALSRLSDTLQRL